MTGFMNDGNLCAKIEGIASCGTLLCQKRRFSLKWHRDFNPRRGRHSGYRVREEGRPRRLSESLCQNRGNRFLWHNFVPQPAIWPEMAQLPAWLAVPVRRRGLQCPFAGVACSACSPACTPDRRLQKAGRLSTAVLSLHLNLVLFYYSSSASPASSCASFATSWPDFTLSPSLTQTFSTVPSMVAITLVSIFIASITATG